MAHRRFLVADLLCGAGGSTEGCDQALVELGFNMEDETAPARPPAVQRSKLLR